MAAELPCSVMIHFGAPIQPRRCSYPGMDRPEVIDPPLEVAELPGILTGWQKTAAGWRGHVTYCYPTHGYGMTLRYVDWFPAERLEAVEPGLSDWLLLGKANGG